MTVKSQLMRNKELKIFIGLDQRLELIGIIETLASYWDNIAKNVYHYEIHPFTYKKEIYSYYTNYTTNNAIKTFELFSNGVLDFSTIIRLPFMLQASSYKLLEGVTNTDLSIYPDVDKVKDFIHTLDSFSRESHFQSFYKHQTSKLITQQRFLEKEQLISIISCFETYAGIENSAYYFIFSPLILGNYSFLCSNYPKTKDVYLVFSPYHEKDGNYYYGDEVSLTILVFHELCHTIINKIVSSIPNNSEIFEGTINSYSKHDAYNDNVIMVVEYLVRTLTIRLIKRHLGSEVASSIQSRYIKDGFDKIIAIDQVLDCFEQNKQGIILKDFLTEKIELIITLIINSP